jgi:hypothetical protein
MGLEYSSQYKVYLLYAPLLRHTFNRQHYGISYKLYSLHPVVCIISYCYDHQPNNKVKYLRVKTKTDVDVYILLI